MIATSKPADSIPGPRAMPLLGVWGSSLAFTRDPLASLLSLHHTYGDVATLAKGSARYVFAFSPALNQQILSNSRLYYNVDAETSPLQFPKNTAIARLSDGLVMMNGARHTQQRRLMLPAFHKQRVEAYRNDIVALIEQHLAGWHSGEQRDLLDEMKQLTIAIAVKTLLGLDSTQEGKALRAQATVWMRLFFSPLSTLLPLNVPGLPYHHLLVLSQRMERDFQEIIEHKRAAGLEGQDALSMLIQSRDEDGAQLSNAELVAQTAMLFLASHFTSSSALTWTFFLLAQHPRALADLLDELDGTLHGADPTIEQLGALPLLEGVVKESMRLLPPFAWSMRINTEPVELGPYTLPKGAHIVFSPAITHRRPDLYPQPERFLPERWQTIAPSPYEYLPFAAGPRMCLGASFAMLEMKLIVARLVQRYRLALPPGARVDYTGLTFLFPKHGLPMQIWVQDRQCTKSVVRGTIHRLVKLE